MARIRSIKPEFWDDDVVGSISRDARLLFIATWNFADDEGRLRWTPVYLKSQVFMYDDDITVDDVARLMAELIAAGFVTPYTAGRSQQQLAFVTNFKRHQKPNRAQPSKLPPPPGHPDAGGAASDTWGPGSDGSANGGGRALPEVKGAGGAVPEVRFDGGRATSIGGADSLSHSLSDSLNDSPPEGRGLEGRGGEGSARSREPSVSRDGTPLPDPEPPRKCPEHAHLRRPPPCGACGDARREHDAWLRRQRNRPTPTPDQPHCPDHPQHPTGSKACPECARTTKPADPQRAAALRQAVRKPKPPNAKDPARC